MAFGIGINTDKASFDAVRGRQVAVACECWFNSRGQVLPRLFKYEEDGEVHTIRNLHVSYSEQKNFDGVSSIEYHCEICCREETRRIKLIFFKEDCRWVMIPQE